MARGLNKVMIIGQVWRDPEMRYTPSGKPVTSFSIAAARSWVTADGEHREATEWFSIVAWRNLAEVCKQHLHKSDTVYIEGRLQTRMWEDPNGQRHVRTEVVADKMLLLNGAEDMGDVESLGSDEYEDYSF